MFRRLFTALLILSGPVACSHCPLDSHGTFGLHVAEAVMITCDDFYASYHRWPSAEEIKDALAANVRGYPDVRFEQLTLMPLESGDLRASYTASAWRGCLSEREALTLRASPRTQARISG